MKRAFTLVELMIVIAIIGLLISVLVPVVARARTQAKLSLCSNNLRQIATGLQEYLARSRDRLPHASYMPSMGPAPLDRAEPIYFANVLKSNVGSPKVFECPDDKTGNPRPAPNNGMSYFQSEKSSYEYRVQFAGRSVDEIANVIAARTDRVVSSNMLWILRDYNNFHGKAGSKGARRYLYIDGHVADFEN